MRALGNVPGYFQPRLAALKSFRSKNKEDSEEGRVPGTSNVFLRMALVRLYRRIIYSPQLGLEPDLIVNCGFIGAGG